MVGWQNVMRESWVGESHAYRRDQTAVGTTNGAGGRNVQILVLSPDLRVLHALPGFWHPDDFLRELRFAETVATVWEDGNLTRTQKVNLFTKLHRDELLYQPDETYARSTWQNFDEAAERSRLEHEQRDTVTLAADGSLRFKPLNVLVHERMAKRPFHAFEGFDVESFVDYGRAYYDLNAHVDGDAPMFPKPRKVPHHWL